MLLVVLLTASFLCSFAFNMLIQPFFKLLNKVCKNICEVYKCYLFLPVLDHINSDRF